MDRNGSGGEYEGISQTELFPGIGTLNEGEKKKKRVFLEKNRPNYCGFKNYAYLCIVKQKQRGLRDTKRNKIEMVDSSNG